uniref:Uncharacterized protein n=1 Tax=viral metagenome TaxID=1070528 RepID=A0A6H1ZWL6_9ZZZZ
MFGKFKPIKIDDKDLINEVNAIRDKKNGFKLMLIDLADAREGIEKEKSNWFDKIFEKYNIPKRYRNELVYTHSTHILKIK